VKGYYIPLWQTPIYKPQANKISNSNTKTFIQQLMKNKSLIPSPSQYVLEGNLADKAKNPMVCKSPRVTEAMQINIDSKKRKSPGVGEYNISPKRKMVGGTQSKMPRITFSEEAMIISKQAPGYVTKNYKHTEKKQYSYEMQKPPPKNQKEKPVNPLVGPASYNVDDAFKQSQLRSPRFYISKFETDNYIDSKLKQAKGKPGIGQYDVTAGDNYVTKGLSKGWK